MRFILILSMFLALTAGLACQNPSSNTAPEQPAAVEKKAAETAEKPAAETKADDHGDHEHGDEAPRISLADAKKDFDGGEVVFIDTRSAVAYKNEHIKGAINVPAGQFEDTYKEIPPDKKIIAYCS